MIAAMKTPRIMKKFLPVQKEAKRPMPCKEGGKLYLALAFSKGSIYTCYLISLKKSISIKNLPAFV